MRVFKFPPVGSLYKLISELHIDYSTCFACYAMEELTALNCRSSFSAADWKILQLVFLIVSYAAPLSVAIYPYLYR